MTNTAHTPGPWLFDEENAAITTYKRIAKGMTRIATMRLGWAEPFESEQIANARLIAAAPELLEALQLILTADQRGFGIDYIKGCARAAIAKATNPQTGNQP